MDEFGLWLAIAHVCRVGVESASSRRLRRLVDWQYNVYMTDSSLEAAFVVMSNIARAMNFSTTLRLRVCRSWSTWKHFGTLFKNEKLRHTPASDLQKRENNHANEPRHPRSSVDE